MFWRKDGKPIRVEYVSTPIYDQQVLVGAVVIFRDITERKENERKLHEALQEVALLRDQLEQENAYLQEAITSERAHHDIVGSSPAVKQIRTRIDLVAPTDATVLITGETGTGKALVANAIHKASARSRRAMITFKCGAVSPDDIEAELFGQVRGAFPGSTRDKPGKLELAHGGTLFLDDISELPLETQGRLLQTLQTGTVTRLGDTRAKALDLHVIAAMNDTPDRAVKSGKLREDLLFFLNVFPISCAPLRERLEDIPVLASHLLGITCRRLNLAQPTITERAVQQMMDYRWPGNVRELRNVLERAAIVSGGGKIILELGLAQSGTNSDGAPIRTEAEMDRMIRDNLIACLRETGAQGVGAGWGGGASGGQADDTLFPDQPFRHRGERLAGGRVEHDLSRSVGCRPCANGRGRARAAGRTRRRPARRSLGAEQDYSADVACVSCPSSPRPMDGCRAEFGSDIAGQTVNTVLDHNDTADGKAHDGGRQHHPVHRDGAIFFRAELFEKLDHFCLLDLIVSLVGRGT